MADNNVLNVPIILAFFFFVGALLGWILEFFYRNLISHSGPRGTYFINPGFCHGPYLPIYGIGLSMMFLISFTIEEKFDDPNELLVILLIGVSMTIIEFIGGIFLLKVLNLRLWDYRDEKGNFMGIICPKFTLIWTAIGAAYYLFIHPIAAVGLIWLSYNLPFCFVIGFFFGIFIIDLISSAYEAKAIKDYADDHDVVVKYEELKQAILKKEYEQGNSVGFFHQTQETVNVAQTLDSLENITEKKE